MYLKVVYLNVEVCMHIYRGIFLKNEIKSDIKVELFKKVIISKGTLITYFRFPILFAIWIRRKNKFVDDKISGQNVVYFNVKYTFLTAHCETNLRLNQPLEIYLSL